MLLAVGAWTALSAAANAATNVQFSGLAVQAGPEGRSRQARIYVGDNQVRLEHARDGGQMVEIYDMKHHRVLLFVPDQKVYMQRDFEPDASAGNPIAPPQDSNPCTSLSDAQCRRIGNDTLYGRPVSQWEISVSRDGETRRSLHWIDDQRHMSLRDVWADGSTTESVLKGRELLHGRITERWERVTRTRDGTEHRSTQWYDPELKIAIREETPDGFYREIRDIRAAPQPDELFQVPPGYQRVKTEKPAPAPEPPPDTTKNR